MRHGFHILGPVELWTGEQKADVGSGKQRAVLAMLLLGAGRPCSAETLIDRLWGDDPPAQARNTLYSYISRLRKVLREAQLDSVALQQRNGGYLLEASPELVDVQRFDAAVQQARCTQDPAAQADLLGAALDCWHGTPLADVQGRWADEMRCALGKRRVGACVDWAAAMIELGRCAEATELLERELVEYPGAEPLAGQLMTALHRQGRHTEALACYATLRRRLVDELGAEPDPALQRLHLQILRSEEPMKQVERSGSDVTVMLNQLADAGLIVINDDGVAIVHQETPKRRRLALVGVSFVLVVLMLVAGFAMVQIDEANWRRDQALATRLTAGARSQLVREPELALLLAKRAVEIDPSESAQAALAQALTDSHIRATWHGHQGPVTGLDVSSDGKSVVTSGFDKTVRVWSITEAHAPIVLTGHTGVVRDAVYSPAGDRIASASEDGTVRIWSAREHPASVRILDSAGLVVALAWSPDGQRIAGAGADGKIRLWQADGSETILDGHRVGANAVAWSPDGRRLASVGNDGKLVVRDMVSGTVSTRASAGGALSDVAWSVDGQQILTGSADSNTRIWPATTDGPPVESAKEPDLGRGKMVDHLAAVETVAYSHNGRYLVAGGRDRTAYIAPVDGRGDKVVLRGTNGPIRDVAFSYDDRLVVTASEDGTVRLWDPSPKPDLRVTAAHAKETTDRPVSPDGEHIATAGDDGTVRITSLTDGTSQRLPSVATGPARDVVYSADGRLLASAHADGTLQVWRLADLSKVVLYGMDGMRSIAFSDDGQYIASISSDQKVRIWKWAVRADPIVFEPYTASAVTSIDFGRGQQLVVGRGDGAVETWNCEVCVPVRDLLELAAKRVTRDLTDEERKLYLAEPR